VTDEMSHEAILSDPDILRKHSHFTKGCGEEECRIAHRHYEREARRRRVRPDSGWQSPYVDEETYREVMAHLNNLSVAGVGWRRLSVLTGLSGKTLSYIKLGKRKRITKRVANLILGVGLHRVPPKRTRSSKPPAATVERCIST
jgi:hypothetical protein